MMVKVDKAYVPVLRFKEFENKWRFTALGDIISVKSGLGFKASEYLKDGVRLLQIENVSYGEINWNNPTFLPENYLSEYPEIALKAGDMVLALNRPVTNNQLKIARLTQRDEPSILYQRVGKIELLAESVILEYLYQIFTTYVKKFVLTESIGSDQPFISLRALYKFKVPICEIPEQIKIAKFLGSVDAKLNALRRKRALLAEYKRGVMQKLFSQQIRFTQDDGRPFPDWQTCKFGAVFARVTRKNTENNQNVLTISAQHGLINQREFFNKSVAAKDVTGYYLLKKDEFAYNKSYSAGYPLGAIKRLRQYDKGVLSTLYICFRAKVGAEIDFYEQYFESGFLNHELYKIAQEGARNHGLLNMSVVEFFKDISIPRPDVKEQQKITDFLTAIDNKITAVDQQITHIETFKKGLLQQMFV